MLQSHTRIAALAIAVPTALALVSGFGAAASAATSAVTAAPAPSSAAPLVSDVALPGGDRVVYQGANGARTYNVVGPNGVTVPFIKFDPGNGNVYVIPESALRGANSLDISQYDVPELSHSAAAASSRAVTPRYPLHILEIDANDMTGAPAQNAVSILVNVDSLQKFAAVIPDTGGVARVAVPAGNYALYTGFVTYDAHGNPTAQRFVLQDDLSVPASGGVVSDTVNESAASALISPATPRPATPDAVTVNVTRTDATGAPVSVQATAAGDVYVSPEPAPAVGNLVYQAMWGGQSPTGTGSPYRYDLAFPASDDVPANESYPVAPSNLATLHYAFDTDAANTAHTGLYANGAVNPHVGGLAPTFQLTVPENLTDYVTAPLPADVTWQQSYQPELGRAPDEGNLFLEPGDTPELTGGQQVWRAWAHGPMAPQVGQYNGFSDCYSCASGTNMAVDFSSQVSDGAPDSIGYYGVPWGYTNPATMNFTLYRDGQQIDAEPGGQGSLLENIPQQTSTYRAVFDVDATGISSVSQSTKTHTDLTFVYDPAGDPHSVLPSGDYCWASISTGTPCQILPMLNLNYQLSTDGTDTSHGPVSILNLTVGHLSFDGRGSQAPAASAKVEVSFDGGTTWSSALTVATTKGHYLAVWPNTGDKGSTPWLRVTATDTIGGSITQTITNAYTIG